MAARMTEPSLLRFEDYGGDWPAYEAAMYEVFRADIIAHDLRFRGTRVAAKRLPEHEKKWASFWHLVSEGRVEDERLPDFRRCERLPFVRWIIENADSRDDIDVWSQVRGSEHNWMLWHQEYHLVVLEQRKDFVLLKTAFCTEMEQQVRRRRKERDAALGV